MKKLVVLAALILACSLLSPVTNTAEAKNGPHCTTHVVHRKRINYSHFNVNVIGTFWYKKCTRPRAGHDIKWIKGASFIGTVSVRRWGPNKKYPIFFCGPLGEVSFFVLRLHVWDNSSGRHFTRAMHIPCRNHGAESIIHGIQNTPRIYRNWVTSPGNRSHGGYYSHPKFRMSLEEVIWGPQPNKQYNVGSGYVTLTG